MCGLISRQRPSALSRRLSYIGSVPDHARAGRGLGHFVSSVAHGVADFAHDVGKVADQLVHKLVEHPESVVNPAGAGGSSSQDSGSGAPSGTHTIQDLTPTPNPVSGSASQQISSSVDPSTSHSSEYTTVSPTLAPSTSASSTDGATNAGSHHSYGFAPQDTMSPSSPSSRQYGSNVTGITLVSSSTASITQSTTTTDALPSNGIDGGGTAHRKGFPLAAAAAIGSVLGFLVVSALFWAVYIYLRKRRRAFHAVYLPPKRMLSVTSGRTVSTVPLFISASEAGVKDESKNPFRHPLDADEEDDPFDAASVWRSSATHSASTLSV